MKLLLDQCRPNVYDGMGSVLQEKSMSNAGMNLELTASSIDQFRSLVDNIPGGVYRCATSDGWPMHFMSDAIEGVTGYPASDFLQNGVRSFASLIHPDDLPMVEDANLRGIEDKQPFEIEYRIIRADQQIVWVYEKGQGVYDAAGNVQWIDGVIFDIHERKQAADMRQQAEQQQMLIQSQAATIAELSAPLIPINDSIYIMPLIGIIDARRAEQIMSTLLEGITRTQAQTIIVDITAITLIDTHVAGVLINAAQGVRLLGASIMLTGIRPEVAQTIIGLGMRFEGIRTESSLQRAISSVLRQTINQR
jgi:rsbT co-antagonist protein RsbR